ncbi:hypothetical protein DPEC_G00268750 [Dallia pectoralis]|uniref:Uncharacterized protein n=1 Tax=Dallia pectoralis TaxID=75939 RepID=A0ACC2FNQ1_DALPE|nr:hypothetical protein DPEC_G00268750 [Dallia pectoralis]
MLVQPLRGGGCTFSMTERLRLTVAWANEVPSPMSPRLLIGCRSEKGCRYQQSASQPVGFIREGTGIGERGSEWETAGGKRTSVYSVKQCGSFSRSPRRRNLPD